MQIDSFTEGLVGANLSSEETVGVDDKGHNPAMLLKVFLREGVEIILGCDGDLIGKDGTAIVFGGLRRDLVLNVTGDDGSIPAPDVHLEGEVLADKRDLVFLNGRMNDGEGVGAGRTLQVLEFVDGDGDTGRGAQHGGVTVGSGLGEGPEGKAEEQSGGDGETIHWYKTHRIVFSYFIREGLSEGDWLVNLWILLDFCIGQRVWHSNKRA